MAMPIAVIPRILLNIPQLSTAPLMKTTKQLLLALFLLALAPVTTAGELIVFGDSLSDTGNLASVPDRGPFPPPFYEGSRVSNGPVAVEVLAGLLDTGLSASRHLVGSYSGNNFAVAGARAGGDELIDLKFQVGAYLLFNGGVAAADNVYLLLIGGNDIRDARGARSREARRILRDAANEIDEQVRLLISAGARAVMLVNVPDIGRIPESLAIAAERGGRAIARRASRYTAQFNRDLARKVSRIERDTGLDLVLFDLERVVDDIIENAAARRFTNTEDGCLNTSILEFEAGCANGANFDRYVFFDQIHPSARTHDIVGRLLYGYIPVAPDGGDESND